ncbi:MAG: hypothetical protein JWM57_170 [Phycisphaerales bacterium]|nr:hypothetical protein [Phycisphaerales bacterium]
MSSTDAPIAELSLAESPPKWRKIGGRLCVAAFVAGILVTLLAWLLPLRTGIEPGVYDVFAAVAFFSRVFLLPMAVGWLVLAVAASICRRWGVSASSVLLAIAWAAPELWMAWPRARMAAVTGPTFSVTSMNLNKDMKDATWAIQVMRNLDSDFIVLQELSPKIAEQIRQGLADTYPNAALFPDSEYDGVGVFSKNAVRVERPPLNHEQRNLAVVVTALGRELELVDIHLAPPQQSPKRRLNRWQVGLLLEPPAADARPTLLVGDFNFSAMTPQACALRIAGWKDAQIEAGHGRHATWPAKSQHSIVPPVRIDTAYARGPLQAVRVETGTDIGSDHLPGKTTWRWAD